MSPKHVHCLFKFRLLFPCVQVTWPPSVVSPTLPLPQPSSLAVTPVGSDSPTTRDSDNTHYIIYALLSVLFWITWLLSSVEQLPINHSDLWVHVVLELLLIHNHRQRYSAVQAAYIQWGGYPSHFRFDSYLSFSLVPSPSLHVRERGSDVLNDFSCHSSPIWELEPDCRTRNYMWYQHEI